MEGCVSNVIRSKVSLSCKRMCQSVLNGLMRERKSVEYIEANEERKQT